MRSLSTYSGGAMSPAGGADWFHEVCRVWTRARVDQLSIMLGVRLICLLVSVSRCRQRHGKDYTAFDWQLCRCHVWTGSRIFISLGVSETKTISHLFDVLHVCRQFHDNLFGGTVSSRTRQGDSSLGLCDDTLRVDLLHLHAPLWS